MRFVALLLLVIIAPLYVGRLNLVAGSFTFAVGCLLVAMTLPRACKPEAEEQRTDGARRRARALRIHADDLRREIESI